MKYPTLTELNTSRELVDVFKGYNHNLRIGDGEFYDMTNLSSDHYPVFSPRHKRGIYVSPSNPQGMVAKDALCYVDGHDFIINEYRAPMELTIDDTPKTLISMGAYVIIMPDKKYINTTNYSDRGNIEATITTTTNITFELCNLDGDSYEDVVTQSTPPSNPENMDYWIDTSETPHQLKQYSSSTAMWSAVATTYIKIIATGIGKPFSVNDGVTISGIKNQNLADLNGWAENDDGYYGTMVIWAKGDDYIVVTGIIDEVITQEASSPISITRRMPNMDLHTYTETYPQP